MVGPYNIIKSDRAPCFVFVMIFKLQLFVNSL